MTKIVAYYRVSTKQQQSSGLGLGAQRHDIAAYAARNSARVIGEYTEAESAWNDSIAKRPQLQAAIDHALAANARLVIGKLDRLARSVSVTQFLKDQGVRFTACDLESANELTVDLMTAVNADESRRISARTRAAMAEAKRRGRSFGTPGNLSPQHAAKGRILGAKAAHDKAAIAYKRVRPVISALRAQGFSLGKIADELNAREFVTRREYPWNKMQVQRVLARA
jgi:DNA invertase Pin-like site-specific DNA recombinase